MISGWLIANSILKKSFKDNILITSLKLNFLVYLLYSNYLYTKNEKLFTEMFVKTNIGPVLPTIEFKFSSFKEEKIDKYAYDATGSIKYVTSYEFEEILNYIWDAYKYYSEIELYNIIVNEREYYSTRINDCINDESILKDEKSRNGIKYEKKLNN